MWWWFRRSSLPSLFRSNLFHLRSDHFFRSIRRQAHLLFHTCVLHRCSHHLRRFRLLDFGYIFHRSRSRYTRNRRCQRYTTRFTCSSFLSICTIYINVTNLRIFSSGIFLAKWFSTFGFSSSKTSRSTAYQSSFVDWMSDLSSTISTQCCCSSRSIFSHASEEKISSIDFLLFIHQIHLSVEYSHSIDHSTLSDEFQLESHWSLRTFSHLQ